MTYPIPSAALDDRLAFVGTAGSGKTYNAGSGVERLLQNRARVVICDPLGVWWGLRLKPDGKAESPFKIVIFGGPHGDISINEHAGALIGETVAGMAESCILDLSQIGTKAGECRFMLAFLTALYRKTAGEPVHLVVDEADMFAPQQLRDKEGEAAKLLGMMETIVRRGRVKGFIPWLITQRPAVLNKNVLSQADGIIAFKLTASQDRDAIGGWIEGQADQQQGKAILASLPSMQRGQGVIWVPGRGVLETATFPPKATFDSSRTPKRGETVRTATLKPIDLGALKERLATVETEAKANDPKALKAEIAALRKKLSESDKNLPADPQAEQRGYERGLAEGLARGENRAKAALAAVENRVNDALAVTKASIESLDSPMPAPVTPPRRAAATAPRPAPAVRVSAAGRSGPEQRILDAIRWWNVMGIAAPSHAQVALIAGYSHKSGTWATYLSRLRSDGMIEGRGDLVLTSAATVNEPDTPPSGEDLRRIVLSKIDGPLQRILTPIVDAYPNSLSHEEAGNAAGYSHSSGTWATYLSRLRTLDLIDGRGELKAQDWLFP